MDSWEIRKADKSLSSTPLTQDFYASKRQRSCETNANENNITSQLYRINPEIKVSLSMDKVVETTPSMEMRQNVSGAATTPRKGEQELEGETRKQSNKELASASSLHEQEECEKLNAKLAVQRAKSRVLTQTLRILSTECLKLNELNNSIMAEIAETYGQDAIRDIKPIDHEVDSESNSSVEKT